MNQIELVNNLKRIAKDVTVLFVEDNDNVRVGTYNILNTFFDLITTAIDGQDGLEIYNYQRYDIVITDINMARMNGLDMIREIKKINPNQPTVIISAHQEPDKIDEAKKLGVDHYIVKPIVLKNLVDTFTLLINNMQKR